MAAAIDRGRHDTAGGKACMRRASIGAIKTPDKAGNMCPKNSYRNGSDKTSKLTKSQVLTGSVVLVCAQLAAASTASCVKALPIETPSVLRGLWRQTLTSFIFLVFTLVLHLRTTNQQNGTDDERKHIVSETTEGENDGDDDHRDDKCYFSPENIILVALAVVGATLLNDTIVVALRYASSAAVMCLCNTTPVWLILYAIINCRADTPGVITILGASLSLVGTIICSTGEDGDASEHENESLGAIIATIGAFGGAIYMTACRKLSPCGLNPIHLSLIINVGMMMTTFILCLATLPDGIVFFSTDISNGFFGFLNPKANPAALLHSVFPDLGGNFGIMIALSYFEPLIVSMVMLTEPLNASVIAMFAVHEAPPNRRTIVGVLIVLAGCAVVLWESNKDAKNSAEAIQAEIEEAALQAVFNDELDRSRRVATVLYSQLGAIAPDVAANASSNYFRLTPQEKQQRRKRGSLPEEILRVRFRESGLGDISGVYGTFSSYGRQCSV